jgi:hypothetical protein
MKMIRPDGKSQQVDPSSSSQSLQRLALITWRGSFFLPVTESRPQRLD